MTSPADPEPFATARELTEYWKPLPEKKFARAGTLLRLASDLIRDEFPSIDASIASGAVRRSTVNWVAMDVVKIAMLPGENEGKTQFQRVRGPFTDGGTLVNPAGTLYLNDEHRKRLGGGVATTPLWHFGDTP